MAQCPSRMCAKVTNVGGFPRPRWAPWTKDYYLMARRAC